MIDNRIRELLKERKSIHSEDYDRIEKCCVQEIELLSENLKDTIDFISNRCTGDEFVWLSEVFEEVQEKTQSDALRECLYATAEKYPKETKEYSILEFISDPEEIDE